MHESALNPRNKEEGASEDNEANDKIISQSDQNTQDYTLGGQIIMV